MTSLSFPLPLDPHSAFFVFDLWVAILYGAVYFWLLPRVDRPQMRWMSLCGAIGGVLISQLFRPSFWDPPSVWAVQLGPLSLAIEDALFGGFFAGITSVLPQLFGWRLRPLEETFVTAFVSRQRRLEKIMTLLSVVLAGSLCFQLLPMNSVGAVSATFLVGAGLLCLYRNDLWKVAFMGGLVTLLVYGLLLTSFLAVVGNREELALDFCQFYVTQGAFSTGLTLAFFAFGFGAFVVPLYAWGRNRHFVAGT